MMMHKLFCVLTVILAALASRGRVGAQEPGDPYAAILSYEFDQPRAAVMAIEAQIRTAPPDELRAIEAKLLQVLGDPAATKACKDVVCRQLRQAGSGRSVAALTPLLADRDLATVARWALQSIPGADVDQALRGAAGRLAGELRAGVLLTLGARRDAGAVPVIIASASSEDAAVAEAALFALGQIGTAEAWQALQAARVPGPLERYRWHAVLRCAEQFAAGGQTAEAARVYQELFQQSDDLVLRSAALRGVVTTGGAAAGPAVLAALRADSGRLRVAAAQAVCERGGPELRKAVWAEFPSLPADVQMTLFGLATDREALPAATAAVQGDDQNLRGAALAALGRVGDASSVAVLLEPAAAAGADRAAAREALRTLCGPEVEQALLAAIAAGRLEGRIAAIEVLAARGSTAAVPELLKLAGDSDPAIARSAWAALGTLADAPAVPRLVELLLQASAAELREAAVKAVMETCRRTSDKEAAAGAVAAALAGRSVEQRAALLQVLAAIPAARSLEVLRGAVNDPDATVVDAAIRALADWPDAGPTGDLLAIARTSSSQVHKVLALRGAIRMAGLPDGRPAGDKVKPLAEVMAMASRPEEKKAALAALSSIAHPAALELALAGAADASLELEAATAVVKIAKSLQKTNLDAAGSAVRKLLEVCRLPEARQLAESSLIVVDRMVNVAPRGTASSPDELDKDGASSGDQAAIDGDTNTYWDEKDGQPLYRLVVTFPQAERIAALSIVGYQHHGFAPRDFEILGDGKLLKKVENAQYEDNFLVVKLDEVTVKEVELKITGYYGGSPAIRELGLYRPAE